MNTEQEPLVLERTYHAPLEKVWKAITNEQDMNQWYFKLPGFKAEPGYKFSFTGGPSPEKQYVHLCEITEVVPMKKLSYTWCYQGYEGSSLVTFELQSDGDKTMLKLSHSGLSSFPKNNPDLASSNFTAGWSSIIGTSLKNYLEN